MKRRPTEPYSARPRHGARRLRGVPAGCAACGQPQADVARTSPWAAAAAVRAFPGPSCRPRRHAQYGGRERRQGTPYAPDSRCTQPSPGSARRLRRTVPRGRRFGRSPSHPTTPHHPLSPDAVLSRSGPPQSHPRMRRWGDGTTNSPGMSHRQPPQSRRVKAALTVARQSLNLLSRHSRCRHWAECEA